jgi:CTP:molybdopterin cytidylyltransferase MocA
MIEAFLKAPLTSNARDVEHTHASHIRYLPVDDPRVTSNVDTPEDYAALARAVPTTIR